MPISDKATLLHEKFLELLEQYNSSDARGKYKLAGSVNGAAIAAFKENKDDVAKIEQYISHLRSVKGREKPIQLSKMILRKLELTGCLNAEIVFKKNYTIGAPGAYLEFGDPSIEIKYEKYCYDNHKFLIEQIHKGNRYYIRSSGNLISDMQVRVVKAPEPVLTAKEYKLVIDATVISSINIPSGILHITDMQAEDKITEIKLEPGIYKIASFHFDTRKDFTALYIALCKIDSFSHDNDHITELPELLYA
jgi:hypothetical protein